MKLKFTRNNVITALFSVLCLLLSVAMTTGTTFGWLTENKSSKGNKIVAGTISVDLLMDREANGSYASIAGETAALFGADSLFAQNNAADSLWEAGKTQIVYLAVKNTGSLAMKYSIDLKVEGDLAPALEYAILDGAKKTDLDDVSDWTELKAKTSLLGQVTAGTISGAASGVLDEIANGTTGETNYFALAIHMKEDATGYDGKDAIIDVDIKTTQTAAEYDCFGNQYDADSAPITTSVDSCLTFSSDNGFTLSASCCAATGLESSTDKEMWTPFTAAPGASVGDAPIMPSVSAVKNTTDGKYYVYLRGEGMTSLTVTDGEDMASTILKLEPTESGGLVDCAGDIMTLLDYNASDSVQMTAYAFAGLFSGCASLRTAPSLPADILAAGCYLDMFNGCTSLRITNVKPETGTEGVDYGMILSGAKTMTDDSEESVHDAVTQMFCQCIDCGGTPVLAEETTYYWYIGN